MTSIYRAQAKPGKSIDLLVAAAKGLNLEIVGQDVLEGTVQFAGDSTDAATMRKNAAIEEVIEMQQPGSGDANFLNPHDERFTHG